jgi:site-specific recombinase XerD
MKLLDQCEAARKVRHLAPRTIQTYRRWVEEFLRFQHDRTGRWIHPGDMGEKEVEAFLTHLAVNRRVAASTRNQALGAILFPYRHVLQKALGSLDSARATKPKRLPTVLSKDEVHRLPAAMPEKGAHRLIVGLLYGSGMRISECCQLRVCDLDFDLGQIVIRGGKGNKDRVTMLPQSLEERLKAQVEFVRLRHEHDVENGASYAPVPTSLEHKRHGAARDSGPRRSK